MVLPKFGLLVVRPCPAEALAALTLVAAHLVLSTQGMSMYSDVRESDGQTWLSESEILIKMRL